MLLLHFLININLLLIRVFISISYQNIIKSLNLNLIYDINLCLNNKIYFILIKV